MQLSKNNINQIAVKNGLDIPNEKILNYLKRFCNLVQVCC